MKKDTSLFKKNNVEFDNHESAQFIYSDLYQSLPWPEEYPGFIQIHSEWPPQSVPLHRHLGPELIYSRNQEIILIIDTEKVILHPGECVLISSGAIHKVEPQKKIKNQDVMSITFKGAYIEKLYPNLRTTKICFKHSAVSEYVQKTMVSNCEELRTLLEHKPPDYFAINEVLFRILGLMFKQFVSEECVETQSSKINRQKIGLVLKYIDEHYREELSAQMVAKEFGYSREYFSRLFKRYADINFKQYIVEYRLLKASVELHTTEKRIADIAYDNGFADEKSFYTSFKKKYGMTPLEFRREKYQKISG